MGQVLFELHQIWCLFYSWRLRKKTPFLVQPKQIFGPSYFVRALVASNSKFLRSPASCDI